jgi:hypothetical protein
MGGETASSLAIEGSAADGSQGGDNLTTCYTAGWYKIYTGTQTDLNGTATLSGSSTWAINLLAFKSTAAGGTTYVPQMMEYYARLHNGD